jgi:hypothetical protein
METAPETDSVDGVQKRRRSASPDGEHSEIRIPEAIIQICMEGRGVRWDNGRICYEVHDPNAFEARYKELRMNKCSKWTWNHLDKYYSLWQSGRWCRKGSCFTPKDTLETRFWQRLALVPSFQPLEAMAAAAPPLVPAPPVPAQQELARVNSAFVDAACEHRQEKLGLQKRVKTLEQDLALAKQACKDQEYHIAQVAAAGGPDFAGERQEWQVQRAEMTRERERLEARVRELEVLEEAWGQVRGIFTSKGPV